MHAAPRLCAVISTPAGEQLTARLYDPQGVLVAESVPLTSPLAGRVPVAHGHNPVGRLGARNLDPHATYVLQVVPLDGGTAAAGFTTVGLGRAAAR